MTERSADKQDAALDDFIRLLAQLRSGDREAMARAFAATYDELRSLAHQRLRKAAPDNVLNTTALVHECYLRLCNLGQLTLANRNHFIGYSARVMRSVVVDFARERLAQRRGAGATLITLSTDVVGMETVDAEMLLAIEDALQTLARSEPRLVEVVEMKYFAGFTMEEIAHNLGLNERTVRRDWEKARMLLAVLLQP